jgi:type II secretory ATPase GspE/PulE/Tfp pilus assembly ATPase PilB-like protein
MEIIGLLRSNALFKDIDEQALQFVAQHCETVTFTKGAPIAVENEPSDHVYFIMKGAVEVVKHLTELKQINRLAILREGAHFSEFSVLNREPKSASVFAYEDCTLLRISGDNFMTVLRHVPAVTARLATQLAEMTAHAQKARGGVDYFKPEQIQISEYIPQLFPVKMWSRFGALPLKHQHQSLFLAVKNPHNAELFTFFKQSQPNLQLHLHLISDPDFDSFSRDLAGAYSGQPNTFPHAQKSKPVPAIESIPEFLAKSTLFKDFPEAYRAQIAQHLKIEAFPPGTKLFKAGTPSDKLFLILSGEVEIYRPYDSENTSTFVATLGAGEYFAEISLLNHKAHGLSARATTPIRVAALNATIVEKLMASPFFSLPITQDLARRFYDINNNLALKTFDAKAGVEFMKLADVLPRSIIEEFQILPLRLKDNELIIGTVTRDCENIYPVISRYLQDYRVSLEIIQPADFKKWVVEWNQATGHKRPANPAAAEMDPVATLEQILRLGFDSKASDLYLEPTPTDYTVRMRVDGVLREHAQKYSRTVGSQMVNRIKVLGQLDTSIKFLPQDGQFKVARPEGQSFARVSTMPTKHGENAVMRLISERQSVPPLASLVPDRRSISILTEVAHSKQGVFLITGPTGSGKSTTLYSLLKELNRVEVSIITVEDPVEMEIPGTTQVEVNEKQGLSFERVLRSVLRQAPDVIMIGEIRDAESAKVAFHAAMTGHLVVSTLHTNNSLEVVSRLIEMGVPQATLAAGLIGASAQRLLRHVCTECREIRPTTPAEKNIFKNFFPNSSPPAEIAHPKGCPHCSGRGYSGRIPVFEIWKSNHQISQLINRGGGWNEFYPEVKSQGFDTLLEFGLKMVINKLTTLEEVQRALGATFADNTITSADAA